MQATQLPNREVQAERSEPDRVPQVLPLVQDAHAAPGDAMTASTVACAGAAARRQETGWRAPVNGPRSGRLSAAPPARSRAARATAAGASRHRRGAVTST